MLKEVLFGERGEVGEAFSFDVEVCLASDSKAVFGKSYSFRLGHVITT